MSTLSKLLQVANDAAKVYEGRERYIRAVKAIKQLESIYREAEKDNEYEDEPDYNRAHLKAAAVISDVCQKNGGIWVKFAQYLSCRPDQLPIEYIEVLQKLQYSAEPTPFAIICQRLGDFWGEGWEKKFSHFDLVPMATASIAQVYKAQATTGEWVAVKVLIPGIEEAFEQDSVVFRSLAKLISPVIKETDIVTITEQLIQMTAVELSFSQEMKNLYEFDSQPHSHLVEIPKVYPGFSNEKILVTEWVEGVLLTHALEEVNDQNKVIIEKLLASFAQQIFKFGVFHADPHPGNIIIDKQRITLLDYGLIAKLSDEQRHNFLAILMLLLSNKGFDQLPELFAKAGFSGIQPEAVKKIAVYLDQRNTGGDLDQLLNELIQELRKHRVLIPEAFLSLARVIIIFCGLTRPYDISLSNILIEGMKA